MSNTKKAPATRPALNRKVTRSTEQKRKQALEQGLVITIDDERYEVRVGDVTPSMARDLRRETGFGTFGLLQAMTSRQGLDIDIIQSFMWLARRISGEYGVQLDDCVFDYNVMLDDKRFTLEDGPAKDDAEDGESPEGSAGSS
jgi:hypothetical protein